MLHYPCCRLVMATHGSFPSPIHPLAVCAGTHQEPLRGTLSQLQQLQQLCSLHATVLDLHSDSWMSFLYNVLVRIGVPLHLTNLQQALFISSMKAEVFFPFKNNTVRSNFMGLSISSTPLPQNICSSV